MPSPQSRGPRPPLEWRPTKIMNVRDLSKDDDFLSHLLIEKLGPSDVPLVVHKMDPSRRLPKTDAKDLLAIIRRLVVSKSPVPATIRQAVDDLLSLGPIRHYLKSYDQQQINAFATHASRYVELYLPGGSIEISHTSRYSHRTGKSELCILATRYLAPGSVIVELKGSMANLTDEEDRELARTGLRHSDIRRDFSVIHSKQMKKNHLFLGPARFVNHDCDNNCELFREGKYITFRVIKAINIGEEITAHYGDGYFGKKNRHCLCQTCELAGRGGYAIDTSDDDSSSSASDSDSDSDSSTSTDSVEEQPTRPLNLDERRTRRGVYAVVQKTQDEDEDDDDIAILSTPPHSCSAPPSHSSLRTSPRNIQPTTLSAIQTHPQKIRRGPGRSSTVNGQLVSPPLSEEADSDISGPSRRATRSTSTPNRTASTTSATHSSLKPTIPRQDSSKTRGREVIQVKTEEVETRLLRTRHSMSTGIVETTPGPSAEKVIPRDPDGNPLPLCSTCSQVIPVIAVDRQVVWGHSIGASPRKRKNIKQDCPRCLRHYAIYGQAWPRRRPLPGENVSSLPTPQEEMDSPTKRVSYKTLSALDRKLAAAVSASATSKSINVPRKRKISEMDDDESLQSVPTPPSQSISAPPVKGKRKMGQPRISTVTDTPSHSDQTNSPSIPFKDQPRSSSEIFGKKLSSPGGTVSLSREQRAQEREKQRELAEKVSSEDQVSRKRVKALSAHEDREDDSRMLFSVSDSSADDDTDLTTRKYRPRQSAFRPVVQLSKKPNPLTYCMAAWEHPCIGDDCTENSLTFLSSASPPLPLGKDALCLPYGFLTFRPSPLNLAKYWMARPRPQGTEMIRGRWLHQPPVDEKNSFAPLEDDWSEDLSQEDHHNCPIIVQYQRASSEDTISDTPSLVRAGWQSTSDSDS